MYKTIAYSDSNHRTWQGVKIENKLLLIETGLGRHDKDLQDGRKLGDIIIDSLSGEKKWSSLNIVKVIKRALSAGAFEKGVVTYTSLELTEDGVINISSCGGDIVTQRKGGVWSRVFTPQTVGSLNLPGPKLPEDHYLHGVVQYAITPKGNKHTVQSISLSLEPGDALVVLADRRCEKMLGLKDFLTEPLYLELQKAEGFNINATCLAVYNRST